MSTDFNKKNVDMLKNKHTVKHFSESLKLKVLAELSEGKYTKREISRLYNIGYSSINDWVHKYKRADLMNQRVTVETMDELSRIQALQKENAKLKDLLINKDLDNLILNSYLDVAAEQLGFKDAGELKKKLDIKQ
jgi:transposase-like protein